MPRGPEFSQDIYSKDSFTLPSEEPFQIIEQDFHEKRKGNKRKHVSSHRSIGGSNEHSISSFSTPLLDALHDIYGNTENVSNTVDPSTIFRHKPVLRGQVLFQNNFRPTTPLAGSEYPIPLKPEED